MQTGIILSTLSSNRFYKGDWISKYFFMKQEGEAAATTSFNTVRLWYRVVKPSFNLALTLLNVTVFLIVQFWISKVWHGIEALPLRKNGDNVNLIVVIALNALTGNQT